VIGGAFIILSSDNNLGRVKDSSVRNLTVILLKCLFLDKDDIDVDVLSQPLKTTQQIDL
jgi:hypothetical protein